LESLALFVSGAFSDAKPFHTFAANASGVGALGLYADAPTSILFFVRSIRVLFV